MPSVTAFTLLHITLDDVTSSRVICNNVRAVTHSYQPKHIGYTTVTWLAPSYSDS